MAFALLLALLTVLAVVGAWAGLQAWPKSRLAATGTDHVLTLADPPAVPQRGPLAKVRSMIEAGFARPTARATASLTVVLDLEGGATDLVLSVLDATTRCPLRAVDLDSIPADGRRRRVEFDAVTGVALLVVVHEKGRSPNFAWLARTAVPELQSGATNRTAELEVLRQRVTVRLHATQLEDGKRFVPITARIRRADDDTWGNSMTPPVAIAFQPGRSDHDLELPILPAGDYRLQLEGFAVEGGGELKFTVPGPALIEVRGAPR